MAKLHTTTTINIISPLIIAIFFVVPSFSSFIDNNGGLSLHSSNQREFDYFVLALQWPGTYCRRTQKCCKINGCCRSSGPPQHFTIHGLWADYNDGSWPSCCSNDNFDMKEIATLRKALDEYWPTLSCGSTSTCHGHKGSFYAHEWEKHGTCSASVTGDEYNYFLTTLNIYFKYNITEVLNEAGYLPSNSEKYPLGGIRTAIENAFHISPLIVCSSGAIQEIRLCFYKDFKPRDCVATSRTKMEVDSLKSSCPKYVSLPAYVSSGALQNGKTFSQMLPDVQDQ
ncbi:hypothetical protein RND81_10G235100 [Saponaria officinalis]|uniref:Uncharacterized protein n=1 Tax=Saponaria officinalis TaxID=3572 RepID=A0AAW1I7R0_SAPOF